MSTQKRLLVVSRPPVNKLVAKKILADTGAEPNLAFTEAELNQFFGR